MKAVVQRGGAQPATQVQKRLYNLRMRAQVMGQKKGVAVGFSNVATGCTDGKTIQITSAAYGDDPDAVDLLEGIGDHEIMHIRYTDFEAKLAILNVPLALSFYRTLEDGRGELAQRRDYPGAAVTIEKALSVLVKRGLFCPPSDDESPATLFSGVLLDYVRGRLLGQSILEPHFQQRVALLESHVGATVVKEFLAIADGILAVKNSQGSVDVALRLKAYLESLFSSNEGSQGGSGDQGSSGSSGDTGDDGAAGDDSGNGDSQDGSSDQDGSGSSGDAGDDEASGDGSGNGDSQDGSGGQDGSGSSGDAGDDEAAGDDSGNGGSQGGSGDQDGSGSSGDAGDDDASGDDSGNGDSQDGSGDQDGSDSSGDAGTTRNQSGGHGAGGSPSDQDKPELPDAAGDFIRQAISASDEEVPEVDLGNLLQQALKAVAPPMNYDEDDLLRAGTSRDNPAEIGRYEALARAIEVRVAAHLETLIEAKIEERSMIADSGRRFAKRRLTRLKANLDPRIFLKEEEVDGVNTAVSVLLDVSGSMDDVLSNNITRLSSAVSAARAAVAALDRHEIPVSLHFFGQYLTPAKTFDEPWRRVRDRHWGKTESSTLTGPAIERVAIPLACRDEERKLLLIVTDGLPYDPSRAVSAIQECQRFDVEVALMIINSMNRNERDALNAFKELLLSSSLGWVEVSTDAQLADGLIQSIREAI